MEGVLEENLKQKSVLREYTEAILVALVLALFIRTFIVQAFKIPSGSMLPTLKIGDHLLVNKFIYGIKIPFSGNILVPVSTPARGDVIVFKYPGDPSIDYIKRVVAVEGDKLEIKNKEIHINDKKVDDSHAFFSSKQILSASVSPRDNLGPIMIPKGKVFVMGDNRDNSNDSRFWGYVDETAIRGKAFILYWSWDIQKPLFSVDRWLSIQWRRIANLVH